MSKNFPKTKYYKISSNFGKNDQQKWSTKNDQQIWSTRNDQQKWATRNDQQK